MVYFNTSNDDLKTIITSINASTPFWRVGHLSAEWFYANGTVANNSRIDGYFYNGSVSSINDTIIIEWKNVTTVGSLPLATFVYLIISLVVILAILALPTFRDITRIIMGSPTWLSGGISQVDTTTAIGFRDALYGFYPNPNRAPPPPSYAETVDCAPGKKLESWEVRECHSMLRKIYALNIDVYNARDVSEHSRHITEGWRRQANAGLGDLKKLMERWEHAEILSDKERTEVQQISARITTIQETPDADVEPEEMSMYSFDDDENGRSLDLPTTKRN